ncbi:MAG: glycosyltransferase [Candidatus Falkowbacteria bacterium]
MLSIIIPALNEEKYLPLLIASIRRQDFSDYEIIVSDANSEDRTREVAIESGAKVVVDERRHPSFQRNTGAKAALGETLLFLDADSVLPDGFLSKITDEFQKRNLGAAGFYLIFGSDKFIYRLCSVGYNFFAWLRQYWRPISVGAGIIAKKTVHEKINGFDETLFVAEDYDYCERSSRVAKFRLLKTVKLPYSVRRMEKEGDLKVLFKWLKMGTKTLFGKKIKKKIVKYDFGNY